VSWLAAARRTAVALGVATAVASALRLVTRRPVAAAGENRWRELSGPDFR